MAFRPLPARSPAALLREEKPLRALFNEAQRIDQLQQLLASQLQPAAREHCHVASWREGRLLLIVTDGHWATRLRYQQRRLLVCRTCQKRFSERQGTPLFDCRLPEAKAVDVLAHLQEGVGVRKTGRLTGVNRNTVVRLALVTGRHAQQVHDERVAFSPPDP